MCQNTPRPTSLIFSFASGRLLNTAVFLALSAILFFLFGYYALNRYAHLQEQNLQRSLLTGRRCWIVKCAIWIAWPMTGRCPI